MEVIEILNSWWKESKVSVELAPEYKRKPFTNLLELFKYRQITIISGLRRVGKSTLIYQIIENLIKNNINPKNILFFSFDEKKKDVIELLEEYSNLTSVDWRKEKCYVFLDEIQKLEGWSNKIKIIYDAFPNIKITISGSSNLQLERNAIKNLAGRHFTININPLTFEEYLEMTEKTKMLSNPNLWENELKKEFDKYVQKPYPEIVSHENLSIIKGYIKTNIIDRIVKDDSTFFKGLNEELLQTLINIFYEEPGSYLNYDTLSNDLRTSKKTLIPHVTYLESAFLIRKVKNYSPNTRKTSKKLQRIYPYHFSLMFGWNGRFDMETTAHTLLNTFYYWREKQMEVDILDIKKKEAIEVKQSTKTTSSDLKNLEFFSKKYQFKPVVIYNGKESENDTVKKTSLWKISLKQKPFNTPEFENTNSKPNNE